VGAHPFNLTLRFWVEILAFAILAAGAWRLGTGPMRPLLAVTAAALAFLAWSLVGVPDDPTRLGREAVTVSGTVRLGIEVVFFAAVTILAVRTAGRRYAGAYAALVLLHHALSIDRLAWLLRI